MRCPRPVFGVRQSGEVLKTASISKLWEVIIEKLLNRNLGIVEETQNILLTSHAHLLDNFQTY